MAGGGPSSGLITQDGRFVADLPGAYTVVARTGPVDRLGPDPRRRARRAAAHRAGRARPRAGSRDDRSLGVGGAQRTRLRADRHAQCRRPRLRVGRDGSGEPRGRRSRAGGRALGERRQGLRGRGDGGDLPRGRLQPPERAGHPRRVRSGGRCAEDCRVRRPAHGRRPQHLHSRRSRVRALRRSSLRHHQHRGSGGPAAGRELRARQPGAFDPRRRGPRRHRLLRELDGRGGGGRPSAGPARAGARRSRGSSGSSRSRPAGTTPSIPTGARRPASSTSSPGTKRRAAAPTTARSRPSAPVRPATRTSRIAGAAGFTSWNGTRSSSRRRALSPATRSRRREATTSGSRTT